MKKKNISRKSQTDWERIDNLKDDEIDLSDNPEITPEMFAKSIVRKGLKPVARKSQAANLSHQRVPLIQAEGRAANLPPGLSTR